LKFESFKQMIIGSNFCVRRKKKIGCDGRNYTASV